MTRRTDELAIKRDDTVAYDRGYWARFDSLPEPQDPDELIGWRDCAQELAFEADPDAWERENRPESAW